MHARAQARARAEAERVSRGRAVKEQETARPRTMYGWPGFGFDPYGYGYQEPSDEEQEQDYVNSMFGRGAPYGPAPGMNRRARSNADEVPHPQFFRRPQDQNFVTPPKRQEKAPSPAVDVKVCSSRFCVESQVC